MRQAAAAVQSKAQGWRIDRTRPQPLAAKRGRASRSTATQVDSSTQSDVNECKKETEAEKKRKVNKPGDGFAFSENGKPPMATRLKWTTTKIATEF